MTDEPALLYTQPGCAESARVRAWLTERGIPFAERDVAHDPKAAMALAVTGFFATPLPVKGDERVLGFRPRELARLTSGLRARETDGPSRRSRLDGTRPPRRRWTTWRTSHTNPG